MNKLRPYQQEAVDEILEHLGNEKNVMYQLSTGGGKTEVAIAVASIWPGRITVITHRVELRKQTQARFDNAGIKARVLTPLAGMNREYDEDDLIIVDEAHHIVASTWRWAADTKALLLGLTATPWRMNNNEGFDNLFDRIVLGPPVTQLINNGYLNDMEVIAPIYGKAIDGVSYHNSSNDFNMTETFHMADTATLYEQPVDWYEDDLDDVRNNQMVVYTTTAEHAERLRDAFSDRGHPCETILGTTAADWRKDCFDSFKNNDLQILINVMVLTEGVDLPDCDRIMILAPTRSVAKWLQMTGRGSRRSASGITHILDGGDNNQRLGDPRDPRIWTLEPRKSNSTKPAKVTIKADTPDGEDVVKEVNTEDIVYLTAVRVSNREVQFGDHNLRMGPWVQNQGIYQMSFKLNDQNGVVMFDNQRVIDIFIDGEHRYSIEPYPGASIADHAEKLLIGFIDETYGAPQHVRKVYVRTRSLKRTAQELMGTTSNNAKAYIRELVIAAGGTIIGTEPQPLGNRVNGHLGIDREELYALYQSGMTKADLGRYYGCNLTNIISHIEKYESGQTVAKPGVGIYVSDEEVAKAYEENGRKIGATAKIVGLHRETVSKRLRKMGIL